LGDENFEKFVNIAKNWSSDTHVGCASPSASPSARLCFDMEEILMEVTY
jgi:hypothetical protein